MKSTMDMNDSFRIFNIKGDVRGKIMNAISSFLIDYPGQGMTRINIILVTIY